MVVELGAGPSRRPPPAPNFSGFCGQAALAAPPGGHYFFWVVTPSITGALSMVSRVTGPITVAVARA